jgi:flagellin
MGLRVNTNVLSLAAQRNLSNVSDRLSGNFRRLASGLRIDIAADDPAGLGISERMRSQVRSLGQAARNTQDGVSLVQSAEGAMTEINSNLDRMRELAIQAANGTYSNEDRAIMDEEFQSLIAEIDRIATTSEFNDIQLLDGTSGPIPIQVGIDVTEIIEVPVVDSTADALGLTDPGYTVATLSEAEAILDDIDIAIDSVNSQRGQLGVAQNRLESSMRTILSIRENLTSAESRIRDVDIAMETADLTRNSILQQASVSVLTQANAQPQIALSLLQG